MNMLLKTLAFNLLFLLGLNLFSQTLVNTIGVKVSEDFNSLTKSNTTVKWSQNSTLANWLAYEMDPYSVAIDLSADSGTGSSGRLYSYGRALSNDRALGSLCSGSNDTIVFGWRLKNNTTKTTTAIAITYTGEQWRRTAGTAANKLLFFYKVASSISSIDSASIRYLKDNGFIYTPSLDFSSPQTGTTTSLLNGNDAANQKTMSDTFYVTLPTNNEILLMWLDDDEAGNDHGLAIDNVSVQFLELDNTPPTIKNVSYLDTNTLIVDFSEDLIKSLALDTSHYKIYPSVLLKSIIYDSILKRTTLKANLLQGKYYSLTINGMKDLAFNTQTLEFKEPNLVFNDYKLNGIIFTEIFYNDPTANDNYEFIEVFNNDSLPMELGGLRLSNDIAYKFAEYTLWPGKAICVPKNKDSCELIFGKVFLGPYQGQLSNTNQCIKLTNSRNQIIDSICYGSSWANGANGLGYSLQLKTTCLSSKKNDLSNSWNIDTRFSYNFKKAYKIWATPNQIYPSWVDIKELKTNDSLGRTLIKDCKVEIRGYVYRPNFDSVGLKLILNDSTGNVLIYAPSNTFNYSVNEGDSLQITGIIKQTKGMCYLLIDTLIIKGSCKRLIQAAKQIGLPGEENEAELVTLGPLIISQYLSYWPKNKFIRFLYMHDSINVFINQETDIDSSLFPKSSGYFITGFVFQNTDSPPFDKGYYLAPRNLKDIKYVSPPQISFSSKGFSLSEGDTARVEVTLRHSTTKPTTITLSQKGGNAIANKDFLMAFPMKLTFSDSIETKKLIKIPLVNNVFDEPNKILQLVLSNISETAEIGSDSIITITIIDNDNPYYPIQTLRKSDAFGVPDSNHIKIQTIGVVYGVNYRPGGLQFTIIDTTGGIGVFYPLGQFGYTVTEGDEILISGTLSHLAGYTLIQYLDTVLKIGSEKPLQSPIIVSKLDEFSESNLIKIINLHWVSTKPKHWLANFTYKFSNGTDTFSIKIDGDIDLAGKPTPLYDTLNITGIGAQVASQTNGFFNDGYMLYPRYDKDIEKAYKNLRVAKTPDNWLKIYPNPTNGNLFLNSSKPIQSLDIFSLQGELITHFEAFDEMNPNIKLDLLSGIYFLKIGFKHGPVFKRIFVP